MEKFVLVVMYTFVFQLALSLTIRRNATEIKETLESDISKLIEDLEKATGEPLASDIRHNTILDLQTKNPAYQPYLDQTLWDNITENIVQYSDSGRRMYIEKVNYMKFKYGDNQDENVRKPREAPRDASDPDSNQDFDDKYDDEYLKRRRRNIYNKDSRMHVAGEYVERHPFSAVVRLGDGCTGTLIWYKHVLTSAHCVYSRESKKYYPHIKKLKVGLLRKDGSFKWLDVKKRFVPKNYIKKEGMKYMNHDYAVLELERPHGREPMPFEAYSVKKNQMIQFAGFPADKSPNELWYTYCSIHRLLKNVFFNHCDATPGMSGSGVYVYNKADRNNRKIVAVFSSNVKAWKRGKDSTTMNKMDFNVATRLTDKKVRKICDWMDAGIGCYKLRTKIGYGYGSYDNGYYGYGSRDRHTGYYFT